MHSSTTSLSNNILKLLCFICAVLFTSNSFAAPISSQNLAEPQIDSFGIIDEASGGLPYNIWQGTYSNDILYLMDQIDKNSQSPTMQGLLRTLLLSKSAPPKGSQGVGQFFIKRLELLLNLGEFSAVRKTINIIPASKFNERHAKIDIQNSLMSDDYLSGCHRTKLYLELYKDPFWQKVNLFCLSLKGKKNEVELGLNLLEEQGSDLELNCCDLSLRETLITIVDKEQISDVFSSFFSSGNYPKNLYKSDKATVSPLEFALLQKVNVPFTESIINAASPALLRSIALYSSATPLLMRIYAAEMAIGRRSMDVAELRSIYNLYKWDGNLASATNTPLLPLRRAVYFQAIEDAEYPDRQSLEEILTLYKQSNLAHVANYALAPTFIRLADDIYQKEELVNIADIAISTLLASGNHDSANLWYRMLEMYESNNSTASTFAKLVRPLTRGTVDIAPSWKPEYVNDWWTVYANSDVTQKSDIATKFLSLLHAFKHDVPSDMWSKVIRNTTDNSERKYPNTKIIGYLKSSAQQKSTGKTILLSLLSLQNQHPHNAPEIVVAEIIQALLSVNLKKQAQSLAIESIINHSNY